MKEEMEGRINRLRAENSEKVAAETSASSASAKDPVNGIDIRWRSLKQRFLLYSLARWTWSSRWWESWWPPYSQCWWHQMLIFQMKEEVEGEYAERMEGLREIYRSVKLFALMECMRWKWWMTGGKMKSNQVMVKVEEKQLKWSKRIWAKDTRRTNKHSKWEISLTHADLVLLDWKYNQERVEAMLLNTACCCKWKDCHPEIYPEEREEGEASPSSQVELIWARKIWANMQKLKINMESPSESTGNSPLFQMDFYIACMRQGKRLF